MLAKRCQFNTILTALLLRVHRILQEASDYLQTKGLDSRVAIEFSIDVHKMHLLFRIYFLFMNIYLPCPLHKLIVKEHLVNYEIY